jgi:endoglucanase
MNNPLRLAFLLMLAAALPNSSLAEEPANLLPNGNFETNGKTPGWPEGWAKPKTGGSWEMEDVNHFVRLVSNQPGETVMLYREVPLPAEVKALELKWRWRCTNLKPGKQPWFDARIMMEVLDTAGAKVASPGAPYLRKSTDRWVEGTTRFLVPAGARALKLMPSLFQVESGALDLDDITLKPTSADALIAAAKAADAADLRATVPPEPENRARWPQELRVEGRRVLNKDGKEVWLQGVNAGGLESLAQDKHVMKSALVGVDDWKANIIRLPVKDDFWFGRTSFQKDGGKAYRENVDHIVTLVANRGSYLLLDLHRFRAPTAAHAEFWKDAAARYKNHPAVIFDLFNEPHGISWEVWRDGGYVSANKKGVDESAFLTEEEKIKNNAGFRSIGMLALLNAVRETGARNIVLAGGLAWANDLSGITKGFALEDRDGNGVIYSWHTYNWHKGWANIVPVAEKYPILVGEFGADTHKMDFIPLDAQEDPYTWVPDMLGFIQKHKLHWTGWCLHPKATPVLISDWDYTPTPFWGAFAKRALGGEQFEMKKMR